MLTTEEFEEKIVAQLSARIDNNIAVVEPCPPDNSQYEFTHPNAAILVRMNNVRGAEPEGATQKLYFDFELITVIRNLRTHTGAYTVLDEIRKAITGMMLPGCSRIYQTSREFLGKQEGNWIYGQTFEFRTNYTLGS